MLPTRGRTIVTVHDLFFLDHPDAVNRVAGKIFAARIGHSLNRADGILTVSQFVKEQVIDRFSLDEKKVKVVYHGVDPFFFEAPVPEETEAAKKKYGLPARFVLFVGAVEPRKNLSRLAGALALVRKEIPDLSLVIAGKKGPDTGILLEKIRKNKLDPFVQLLDYVPDRDIRVLYHTAACLVFPSLCEGFGLPVLEAMAAGCPCVVSRVSALPEVAKEAALYFHPEDEGDMARQIVTVCEQEEIRRILIERGLRRAGELTWRQTAENTLAFYRHIVGGSPAA